MSYRTSWWEEIRIIWKLNSTYAGRLFLLVMLSCIVALVYITSVNGLFYVVYTCMFYVGIWAFFLYFLWGYFRYKTKWILLETWHSRSDDKREPFSSIHKTDSDRKEHLDYLLDVGKRRVLLFSDDKEEFDFKNDKYLYDVCLWQYAFCSSICLILVSIELYYLVKFNTSAIAEVCMDAASFGQKD